ncbi:MAG: ribbon-helix-helix protein, CopG family [Nitriliruptorales bacterium]
MIRTQISLTAEQHERLRRRAAERGVSMSELIREAVDVVEHTRRERLERARAAFGRHGSGRDDVSEEHDRHLVDVYPDA